MGSIIEIELNKTELETAPYSYILDVVDDNGKHVEVYKDNNNQLWFGINDLAAYRYFNATELSTILNDINAGDNIKLRITWSATGMNLSIVYADSSEHAAPNGNITPPALSFTNPGSMIYVGSKVGGATKGTLPDPNQPSQYSGMIKSIIIRQ